MLPGRLGLAPGPYHGLAADYDWIFDDGELAGGSAINRPATAPAAERSARAATCSTLPRPGGRVVIDSRNWEKLYAERRIVQAVNGVKTRGGRRCGVLYAWEVPDRLEQQHVAHLVFLFEDGDRVEPDEYRLSFRPFTLGDFARAARARGTAGNRHRL